MCMCAIAWIIDREGMMDVNIEISYLSIVSTNVLNTRRDPLICSLWIIEKKESDSRKKTATSHKYTLVLLLQLPWVIQLFHPDWFVTAPDTTQFGFL